MKYTLFVILILCHLWIVLSAFFCSYYYSFNFLTDYIKVIFRKFKVTIFISVNTVSIVLFWLLRVWKLQSNPAAAFKGTESHWCKLYLSLWHLVKSLTEDTGLCSDIHAHNLRLFLLFLEQIFYFILFFFLMLKEKKD